MLNLSSVLSCMRKCLNLEGTNQPLRGCSLHEERRLLDLPFVAMCRSHSNCVESSRSAACGSQPSEGTATMRARTHIALSCVFGLRMDAFERAYGLHEVLQNFHIIFSVTESPL